MDNIWEKYIEKNFYNNVQVETQKSSVFISDDEKNETKTSRPDFIGSTFISDAKYKKFTSLTKVSDADIDKLIRDITINEKDNGKLIFPKTYNVQDKSNYANIEKLQYKFKTKSLEKNIEIILLPFLFN
jgi:hypothetical protein